MSGVVVRKHRGELGAEGLCMCMGHVCVVPPETAVVHMGVRFEQATDGTARQGRVCHWMTP
jgi:hypothetical protein